MKKILLGLFVLMTTIVSCTDQEDIEIAYQSKMGITAAHIFDDYSQFKEGDFDMSKDGWKLNLLVLVYDENGKLVDKTEKLCNSLSESLTYAPYLAPGNYTVVSIADFRDGIGGSGYKFWNIENESNIQDLSITENDSYFPVVFETLGIDVQNIEITNTSKSIVSDIKPVTSLVTVFMDDKQHLHYGIEGKYSAKCRMVVQYNIQSLSSNSKVRFSSNGTPEYQTKEQSSEYNTAKSRPHDKMDENSAPIDYCYRALLPEEDKEFQWKIYNRDDELTDDVTIIVGNYPTQGKSDKILDIKSGKQYALMMILDATQLLFEETGKDAFNFDDYVSAFMKQYEINLIDDMLNFGYDQLVGMSDYQLVSYLGDKPHDYSSEGTIAYYPHSPSNHFEQFVTVRYTDSYRTSSNRIMLSLSLPDKISGSTKGQSLPQEVIDALVTKLNQKYTYYSHIGDVYQWTDGENVNMSNCGITLDVSDPCNSNLYYDRITQKNEEPDDEGNLWADFTSLFGADANTVNSTVKGLGCSYSFSDYSYSVNGSDYYYIENNNYADLVGFVFNTDNQVSQYWVYFKPAKVNDAYNYLAKKYTAATSESTEYTYVFYNDNKNLKVVLDLMNGAVIYTKLDMKQHETPA